MVRTLAVLLLAHEFVAGDPDEVAVHSRLHGRDPTLKLLAALAFAVAVAFLTDRILLYIALAFALAVLAIAGLPLGIAAKRLVPVVTFALMAALSVGLFRGLAAFEVLLVRILAATIPLLAMLLTTTSMDLARALRRLGFPALLRNAFLLTYRYLFLFGEESRRMKRARQARGFEGRGSLRSGAVLQTIANTAGMILVRAHGRSRALHRAMLARHFTGDVPLEPDRRVRAPDVALFLCFVAIAAWLLAATAGVVPRP